MKVITVMVVVLKMNRAVVVTRTATITLFRTVFYTHPAGMAVLITTTAHSVFWAYLSVLVIIMLFLITSTGSILHLLFYKI